MLRLSRPVMLLRADSFAVSSMPTDRRPAPPRPPCYAALLCLVPANSNRGRRRADAVGVGADVGCGLSHRCRYRGRVQCVARTSSVLWCERVCAWGAAIASPVRSAACPTCPLARLHMCVRRARRERERDRVLKDGLQPTDIDLSQRISRGADRAGRQAGRSLGANRGLTTDGGGRRRRRRRQQDAMAPALLGCCEAG